MKTYDRQMIQSWSSSNYYSWDDNRHDEKGPPQRPRLNLKPQNTPKEDNFLASSLYFIPATFICGGAKPVDKADRKGEAQLQKEQEKLQHPLDELNLECQPQQRYPQQQREETQETEPSRTGSKSSQDWDLSHILQKCMKERECEVPRK